MRMLGTELLEELVQTCATSWRTGHPVSLVLIADPESGKTSVTEAAGTKNRIVRITVTTGIGIVRELDRNAKARVIVVNDLSMLKGLNSRAAYMLIQIFNGFTEEGLHAIAMPRGKKINLKSRKGVLILCITTESFAHSRRDWFSYGFLSRCIPFCYEYSSDLCVRIKNGIDTDDRETMKRPEPMQEEKAHPVSIPKPERIDIRKIADRRGSILAEKGLRLLKNYRNLCRAHALLKHRSAVDTSDVDFLYRVDQYVHYTESRTLGSELERR